MFVIIVFRDLNMSQYVTDPENKTNYIYDLCGVINHIGHSLYVGHYTAFSRTHHKNDSSSDELGWRLFDDAHVQAVTNLDHIVTQDAYVLLYRLRDNPSSHPTPAASTTEHPFTPSTSNNKGNLPTISPPPSDGEYFDLNSDDDDESEELNSNSNGSSESLQVQLDDKSSFTNLNDID